MGELRISTNDIASLTIKGAIAEIEDSEDMLNTARAIAERKNIAIGDMIEAIASHIVYDDTDYVCE